MGDFTETVQSLLDKLGPQSKSGLRILTAVTAIGFLYFFLAAFIAPIAPLSDAFKNSGIPSSVWHLGATVLLYLLVVLVFSDDGLYYGDAERNCFARAFQRHWPSSYLAQRLNIDPRTARNIWFSEFNKWGEPGHPSHSQRVMTFRRGYACRLVYYFLRFSKTAFFASALLLTFELVLRCRLNWDWIPPESLPSRAIYVSVAGIAWLLVLATNRTDPPTGVWRRFDEVNELNIHWIDTNLESLRLLIPEGAKADSAPTEEKPQRPE